MLKNYLTIALRNLLKYKTYSVINISGLAVGLGSSILILLFVRDELNYDTFHEKAARIYRVVTEAKNAAGTLTRSAKVAAPWGPMLRQELPEVESFVRFRTVRRSLLQHGGNTLYESGGLYADAHMFEVFSFDFIQGDPATALAAPNAIVLTKTLAHKLFGETSALALVVACIGLLALASFTAEQRTKEIGVRKVLGASTFSIVAMLSTEFVMLVTMANLVAWPIAWLAMNQWLQNFAYRIDLGWWMFALAGGLALAIALLTVSAQAIKAALANPVEALRYE